MVMVSPWAREEGREKKEEKFMGVVTGGGEGWKGGER